MHRYSFTAIRNYFANADKPEKSSLLSSLFKTLLEGKFNHKFGNWLFRSKTVLVSPKCLPSLPSHNASLSHHNLIIIQIELRSMSLKSTMKHATWSRFSLELHSKIFNSSRRKEKHYMCWFEYFNLQLPLKKLWARKSLNNFQKLSYFNEK